MGRLLPVVSVRLNVEQIFIELLHYDAHSAPFRFEAFAYTASANILKGAIAG